jgi:type VI secretion system protein ImpF
MADIGSDQPLVPSLLDRLIDEQPEQPAETPRSQNQILAELRQTIRRDLENLLNTRCPHYSIPGRYPELEKSIVNYGIPDIVGLDLESEEVRSGFLERIEGLIRYFEPRFLEVRVVPLETEFTYDRSLKFRIEGRIQAYPAPEPIVFDSELEPSLGQFSIERIR